MEYYFTDNEINELTLERKEYNGTVEDLLKFKESDGHKRSTFEISSFGRQCLHSQIASEYKYVKRLFSDTCLSAKRRQTRTLSCADITACMNIQINWKISGNSLIFISTMPLSDIRTPVARKKAMLKKRIDIPILKGR